MDLWEKTSKIPMPEGSWKLLTMLLQVVNYDNIKRNEPQIHQSRLIGAIVSVYLFRHEADIRNRFFETEAEVLRSGAPANYYTPAQLAGCDAARGAEATKHTRIGARARNAAAARQREGLVRIPSRRSPRPVPWAPRISRELREWGQRALAELGLRSEEEGGADPRGAKPPGPSNGGVRSGQAPKTGWWRTATDQSSEVHDPSGGG
jgi:hypothetical protein